VEQMSGAIREISQSAANTASLALDVGRRADSVGVVVDELASSVSSVAGIVDLISDIADQTNLLALNATIEAANAGSAGAGFAVVAREVKELANRTAQATQQIQEVLQRIQSSTGRASDTVDGIKEAARSLEAMSQSSAAAIEEQSATMGVLTQHVQGTRRACEGIAEEAAGAAHLAQTVGRQVNDVTIAVQTNAAAITETSASAQQLASLATRVDVMSRQFNLKRDPK